jgi:hypothetical protein
MTTLPTLPLVALLLSLPQQDLSQHFGFDPLEVVKVGPNAGPVVAVDMNGDGLGDLVVANNHDSRIEVHLQKKGATEADAVPPTKVNEIPEHWRFRRVEVPVGEAIGGIIPHDANGDGRLDLVAVGTPNRVVFYLQQPDGTFKADRKHTVKNLAVGKDALAIADVMGDAAPELLVIAGQNISVHPMKGTDLGAPVDLIPGAGGLAGVMVGDLDANGSNDIVAVLPDDTQPIRIWYGTKRDGLTQMGPQVRYDMPVLREAALVKINGKPGTSLGTIEKKTKRTVVHSAQPAKATTDGGKGELVTWSFEDPSNRKRDFAVADVDGDGLPDLVATNTESNAVSVYRQQKGVGFGNAQECPSYAELDFIAARDVDGDGKAEVFVSSEKEGVVGRSAWKDGTVGFPQAAELAKGLTPVAMNVVMLQGVPTLAVIAKENRNYRLELIDAKGGSTNSIDLGALSRAPDTILSIDADQDGKDDLLLFTPEKPMTMVRWDGKDDLKPYVLLESKDMSQFGLAQAANAQNTEIADANGDGKAELLVADRNFIRALRYDTTKGWQVVEQVNAARGDSKLVALALRGNRLVAGDKENGKILVFERKDGAWKETEALDASGFKFTALATGPFAGGEDAVLLVGDEGFGVLRDAGPRMELAEVGSFRSDSPRRVEHEIGSGDVNGDGRTDLLLLDAGEQNLEILTFSDAGKLLYATGFEVFETKMFSGGEPKEFQPSQVVVLDVTGDGADDVILLCHDRVLVYPQMTKDGATR